MTQKTIIAVQWPRFGPYHVARLNHASLSLSKRGNKVVGLQMASNDQTYQWERVADRHAFETVTAMPEHTYENIPRGDIWRATISSLDQICPDMVLVCGYSAVEAFAALYWCRMRRKIAVLMTDSKGDDKVRNLLVESIKRRVLKLFDAAICAGSPHRKYLISLGFADHLIFEGGDVVDNQYFRDHAAKARNRPEKYFHLPGLEYSKPFFLCSSRLIKRKNIDGLLIAYSKYRQQVDSNNGGMDPWRLVILGDGPERGGLEKLIEAHRIQGVTIAGFVQIADLPVYYGLAKTFIHPAIQDQWGLVVNEAMAAACPVLVSKGCGCAADLVRSGCNGYVFDPLDLDGLSGLMGKVHREQDKLGPMGEHSKIIIESWDLDLFSSAMLNAYLAVKTTKMRDRI